MTDLTSLQAIRDRVRERGQCLRHVKTMADVVYMFPDIQTMADVIKLSETDPDRFIAWQSAVIAYIPF